MAGIHPPSAGETTRAICLGYSRCVVGLLPYIQVVGCPVHAVYHLDHPPRHSANWKHHAWNHHPSGYQRPGDSSQCLDLPTVWVWGDNNNNPKHPEKQCLDSQNNVESTTSVLQRIYLINQVPNAQEARADMEETN